MVEQRYAKKVAAIKGIDEADRILKEFAQTVPRNITKENFEELGKRIVDAASARTPIKTGRLVSSNKVLVADDKKLIVGNIAPYAKYVHDGTSRMPARPFFAQPLQVAREMFPDMMIKDCSEYYKQLVAKNKPK